jgi:hypothetical protein
MPDSGIDVLPDDLSIASSDMLNSTRDYLNSLGIGANISDQPIPSPRNKTAAAVLDARVTKPDAAADLIYAKVDLYADQHSSRPPPLVHRRTLFQPNGIQPAIQPMSGVLSDISRRMRSNHQQQQSPQIVAGGDDSEMEIKI